MKARTRKRDRGQALALTAFAMVSLMGFLGLATDVGLLFRDKVNLQKVADAAAIAGAAETVKSGNYTAAAQDSAAQNGVINGTNGTVTVSLGTTYHPSAVKVYVTQTYNTYIMTLFGYRTVNVGATAVAGITQGPGCLIALDTSPFKGLGLTNNGSGTINAPTCDIFDNSGMTVDGKATVNAQEISVSGTYTDNGGSGNISPAPVNGVQVKDPLLYWTAPSPSGACVTDPHPSSGTVSPGCYKGLTLTGSVVMKAGLYIIQNGALTINGGTPGVTGTGVSIFIDGANNGTFNSINNVTLVAPTTGTSGTCTAAGGCNGILLWDTESTNKAQQGLDFGPGNSTLTGILYFPNADLKFHGNNNTTLNSDVIALAYVFDGTININNYVLSPGQGPLFLTPTIVE
jgi:Flp pilus assembly protein TadG